MWIRCTHEASPHSQIRSSGMEPRSNFSASVSMRSLTSRKTASLRLMRSSRVVKGLLHDHIVVSARDDPADGFLGLLVADGCHVMVRVLAHGAVLRRRQLEDLDALLVGTLAQKGQPLHLCPDGFRPLANRLVRFLESLIVRHDPFQSCIVHYPDLGPVRSR